MKKYMGVIIDKNDDIEQRRVIPFSAFYPFFRVLSLFPRFIPFSAFYPFFRVLSFFPRFIPFSAFYPFFRVLSLFPRFIPFSAFYPFFRVLSLFPCFIPFSAFYPFFRVLSLFPLPQFRISVIPDPCFIPTRCIDAIEMEEVLRDFLKDVEYEGFEMDDDES